ncbi:MAG: PQQ-dependent sugar dehydrogenase [Saprospiraceae bacterium]
MSSSNHLFHSFGSTVKRVTLLFCVFYAASGNTQSRLTLVEFARGLTKPVDISHAGDERLFIVEKNGYIRILQANGALETTPFLDIDDRVRGNESERGLLGLAFHPDYANNGYFFVNYTNNDGDTRISRFKVSANNPNQADPNSEKILLSVDQPFENHNGGELAFGPDGYLYIALGDGGSGGDPNNAGQTRTNLLGKMLRIDVNNGNPYAIPADNPFANDDFTLDEVWALGLRNPWRFSFDRLTGDLWIGDVGQGNWEEINFQLANSSGGENYGWRCYEGNAPFNTSGCPGANNLVFPIHDYSSNFTIGCSVTGGFVYRGSAFPDLYGHYVYTDYCSGRIWSIVPDGEGGWTNTEWLDGSNSQYSSFGEDQNGELYLAAIGGGQIFRVVDQCAQLSVSATVNFITCTGAADGSIQLAVENPANNFDLSWSNGETSTSIENLAPGAYSYTLTNDWGCTRTESFFIMEPFPALVTINANGNQLSVSDEWETYQWLLNGDPIPGASEPTFTALISGDYTIEVADGEGCTFVSQVLSVQVSAINEELNIPGLVISPNPSSDAFAIEMAPKQGLTLQLLDETGRLHFQQRVAVMGKQQLEVPVKHLSAGVYFFTFTSGDKKLIRKVIKD